KKLSLLDLTPTRMTLKLGTRSFSYPAGIAKDVFVLVGKFTFPADFVVVDYDVDPRVPLILERPFLRTDCFPKVLKFKKSNHPSSGGTTPLSDFSLSLTPFESSDSLLEEFADELAFLYPFPPRNEDDNFDFNVDLREIKFLLNQDPTTESNIEAIDPILEKFTDEPSLDYLPLPGDDDDDLFELKSDNDEWKSFCMLLDNDSTHHEESYESSEIATLSSSPFGNEDKIALDYEDSRAHGFVHRSLELLSLSCLYMVIRYPRSY
nr:reverse transcriptase domain-containing protein [Tanacetum cinerariifolium]